MKIKRLQKYVIGIESACKRSMISKCILCGMRTYQKNGICVLCENGITLLYNEQIDLLKKDNKKDKKKELGPPIMMIEVSEKKSTDRRMHFRYDLPFSVFEFCFNPNSEFGSFMGFTLNISDSGLCIKTSKPLKSEQKIIIKSLLFTESKRAIVRWVEKIDSIFYKVGLEFI